MASTDKSVVGMRFMANLIDEKIDPQSLFFACENGKTDYISYLSQCLGDDFDVCFLGGNNNPVAKISHPMSNNPVVLRFIPVNRMALKEGVSSEQALFVLQASPRYQKPFFSKQAVSTEFEYIMLECSPFHANGSLERHCNEKRSDLSHNEFAAVVSKQVRNLLFLVASLRRKGVWHTDIKPSNVLLDERLNLVLSDTKGLLLYAGSQIKRNKIDASAAYYDDSILDSLNSTDLNRLLQLNVAVSIYEMLTGELPTQECAINPEANANTYRLVFDFNDNIYNTPDGKRLKACIESLVGVEELDISLWLKTLAKPAFKESTAGYRQSLLDISSHRQPSSLLKSGPNI